MESKDNVSRDNVSSGRRCLYLGIDAGQTHMEAALVSEAGEVLAQGAGGPSHVQGANMGEVFRRSLLSALGSMSWNSGCCAPHIVSVGVGVSGLGIPGKRQAVLGALRQLFPSATVHMDNDAVVHHWGAAGSDDGASILAGTGTIAYGEYKGVSCRLGGFGYLFGDEGGGFWIGSLAIRRAIRAAEGRAPATALTKVIEDYFDVEDVRKIPGLLYSRNAIDVKQIAELAPLVCAEAKKGDETAREIVVGAGEELGGLAVDLLKKLNVPYDAFYPVYRLGGIWKAGDLLNVSFMRKVNEVYPNVVWATPRYTPAVGAALMARSKNVTNVTSSEIQEAKRSDGGK